MKCLIIHGSPRRGNTWDVLNIAKEEMQKNGDFEFEVIELAKEKIPMCIGCFNCIAKGETKCPHNSYIDHIVKKMEEADAFIITSPVYSMQVSGTLKNFIDHMSYNFHRPKFYNKKVLIITTTAGAGHTNTANYIKEVMEYWGVNYVQTIPIAYRSLELSEKNKNKILKGAKAFSKELNSHKIHQPKLKSLMMFHLWKNSSKEDGFSIADFKYWNDEHLKKSLYYEDIQLGVTKKFIAIIFKNLFK
ncbi:NAD(P)H-dependent oxidoreductase [Clostridioides difficile]